MADEGQVGTGRSPLLTAWALVSITTAVVLGSPVVLILLAVPALPAVRRPVLVAAGALILFAAAGCAAAPEPDARTTRPAERNQPTAAAVDARTSTATTAQGTVAARGQGTGAATGPERVAARGQGTGLEVAVTGQGPDGAVRVAANGRGTGEAGAAVTGQGTAVADRSERAVRRGQGTGPERAAVTARGTVVEHRSGAVGRGPERVAETGRGKVTANGPGASTANGAWATSARPLPPPRPAPIAARPPLPR